MPVNLAYRRGREGNENKHQILNYTFVAVVSKPKLSSVDFKFSLQVRCASKNSAFMVKLGFRNRILIGTYFCPYIRR
jgi:hypothetical protein